MKYFWRVYRSDGGIDEIIGAYKVEVTSSGVLIFTATYPEVIIAPGTWLRVLRVVEVENEAQVQNI